MYKTQIEAAKQGIITPQMEVVAKKENMDVEILRDRIARGTVVIPAKDSRPRLTSILASPATVMITKKSSKRFACPLITAQRPSWICPTTARRTPSVRS